jgi:hypothetical protein
MQRDAGRSSRKRDRKLLRKLPLKHELDTLVSAQLQHPELAGMKPVQISKLLKVDVREVYAAKQRALHQAKKSRVPRPDGRAGGDRGQLLHQTQAAVEAIGLPYVNTVKILAHMRSEQKVEKLPCATTVNQVLRRDFKLRYRLTNAASIKYNDTDYDEKRRWISRLLAQFMMADVVIVSIDESSFKQEGIP